jgi:hypothetical protein
MLKDYDFSGWATKNDLKCSDGRVIRKDAFKDDNGITVPLVYQHSHNDPMNVLGHAMLENRPEGVYAYCKLNGTQAGQTTKDLIAHGDIKALSIYANKLIQKGSDVIHGAIREVSVVLSGANPGALIDFIAFVHSDNTIEYLEDEAIIYTGFDIELKKEEQMTKKIEHADGESNKEETVQDVLDSMSEKQKTVMYALIAQIMSGENEVSQSDINGGDFMKHNLFEGSEQASGSRSLTHDEFSSIVTSAKELGSFRKAVNAFIESNESVAHAGGIDYGITDIDFLFPDAKTVTPYPNMIKRDTDWVAGVLGGTRHSPFARIKSIAADITAEEARAKGYVTGSLKKDEVVKLLKRITTPTTIYKKQKLDRDDIVDIVDIDVVRWLKMEMRIMLDEEIARAVLVGDGRDVENEDKISETNIRPIYTDDDLYSHHVKMEADSDYVDYIDAIVEAREFYKGTGNPTFYTSTGVLTKMLLIKDTTGRRIYPTVNDLKAALLVNNIVEVPVMSDLVRTVEGEDLKLVGILVNLSDYTIGADKGGEINMFDDFDIDYNQMKYLIETRISGALTVPKSALVIEVVQPAG